MLFLLLGWTTATSQPAQPSNTPSANANDTTSAAGDALPVARDTVVMETQDGLETVVTIVANDSSWNQVSKNVVHLYKGAKVKYQDFELSADYIRLDRNTNLLFASGVTDDNGKYVGRPVVIFPGETPKTVDSLFYDYRTQEGNTYGIMTEEDGAYIQAKVLRKNWYDEISLRTGLYSTCNLPAPHTHFGLRFTKLLLAKNHIVVGPAFLEVVNIPIKFIAVPFAFFPKQDKKASGFLFPSFGEDGTRGFAMRDIGWYLTFNDFWDSELRGTLYSKGSWETSVRTNYLVNYKFSGGFKNR